MNFCSLKKILRTNAKPEAMADYDDGYGVYDDAPGGTSHPGYSECDNRQDFSGYERDFYQDQDFHQQGYQDEHPGVRCSQHQGFRQDQEFFEPQEEDFLGESFEDQRQYLDEDFANPAVPSEQYQAGVGFSRRWDDSAEGFEACVEEGSVFDQDDFGSGQEFDEEFDGRLSDSSRWCEEPSSGGVSMSQGVGCESNRRSISVSGGGRKGSMSLSWLGGSHSLRGSGGKTRGAVRPERPQDGLARPSLRSSGDFQRNPGARAGGLFPSKGGSPTPCFAAKEGSSSIPRPYMDNARHLTGAAGQKSKTMAHGARGTGDHGAREMGGGRAQGEGKKDEE